MDAVGCERAALLAQVDAGPLALFFAGSRPERTSALILAHTTARFAAADDYPIGAPAEVAEAILVQFDQLWGSEALAGILMPSRAGDERFLHWFAKLQRTGASPRAVQVLLRAAMEVDARPILPVIHAPTLVLHRRDVLHSPIRLYGSASTSQRNCPKLNCPAWKMTSGSSSSGPLKKNTILPTSTACGGPPPTIR
jgi:pimeloyl-ACP methyl ester carboxylesterase